jgi:UDP-N-acetyl-D-glucosamine dehydrogenase
VRGSRILVFGVAYKADIDDHRESPAVEIIDFLRDRGAEVRYVDPHVPALPLEHDRITATPLSDELLEWADLGVVVTAHRAFRWPEILEKVRLVFDTRNAILTPHPRVVRL